MNGPTFRAARMEDLRELLAFVDAECERTGVPEDAAFALRLAAEETFTNIVRHGYAGGAGPVSAELVRDHRGAVLTLQDQAPPFDPRQAPPPDLDSPAEERPVGGLGWHLVRELVDEIHHRPTPDGGNVFTLIKHLGDADAD